MSVSMERIQTLTHTIVCKNDRPVGTIQSAVVSFLNLFWSLPADCGLTVNRVGRSMSLGVWSVAMVLGLGSQLS